VENYLDEFQSLVSEANYIDSHILVVKFCRDLHNTIQNQIVILLVDKPDNILCSLCEEMSNKV